MAGNKNTLIYYSGILVFIILCSLGMYISGKTGNLNYTWYGLILGLILGISTQLWEQKRHE